MKNVKLLTIFLCFGGIFMSLEGVSGRTHETKSPPRNKRQVTGGNYMSANSNDNNNYYDPYFLSSSSSAALHLIKPHHQLQQKLLADNNELIASGSSNSNSRTNVILKNDNNNIVKTNNLLAEEISATKEKDYYDPFFYYVPAVVSPYTGTRNRRNSHGTHITSPATTSRRHNNVRDREVAYLYERNSKSDNNIFPNQPPPHRFQYQQQNVLPLHRNPNVFLTKQQVLSAQSRYNPAYARYYVPTSNAIDDRRNYYDHGRPNSFYRAGSSAGIDNKFAGDDGGAWSIQVGTQLKVNDDGRERNPEQFYVRDETRGGGSNRRYTSYYRK